MKEVKIFIASSMAEFKKERTELLMYFDTLNKVHKQSGVQLVWNMPEKDMSTGMRTDGSQARLDEEIRDSDYCVFIVGTKLGQYTLKEFEVARDSYLKSDEPKKPKILSYFLPPYGEMQTREVIAFEEHLKDISYYYKVFKNISDIKAEISIELERDGVFYPKPEAPIEPLAPHSPAPMQENLLEMEQTYQGQLVYYLKCAASGDIDAYQGVAANYYNLGLIKAKQGKLSVAKHYFEQSLFLFNLISEDDAIDCRNRLAELQKLEDSGAPDDSDEEDMEQAVHLSGIATGSGIATMINGLFSVFLDDD